MTHPFHPLFGEELEFVKRRRSWRADRVYVLDPNRLLLSLPVEWTDVVGEDPFVVVAAGRSPFHTVGLLGLGRAGRWDACRAVDGRPVGCQSNYAVSVESIMPTVVTRGVASTVFCFHYLLLRWDLLRVWRRVDLTPTVVCGIIVWTPCPRTCATLLE